jgi:hypothetical protein
MESEGSIGGNAHMKTLKAQVQNGRLVLDEPSKLPEGTIVELIATDSGDELDEDERAALHAALADAWASARAGDTKPAEELLKKLRSAK